ncbi:hypothetical protein [Desulfitobacterium sp. PCE1]|uniref:hypothetical protein n=1 Tax=Desulfitobacterium sp. PCE1 TaxID=146907 RepID=UPI00036F7D9A|nr:hypothetical protein [Desulfitobacterium sp. PCE1]
MPEITLPTKTQVDSIKIDTSAIITKVNTNLDTAVSSRATQTSVNTINTNVGSNADTASAEGSIHAKLKDIKTTVSMGTKYRPLNVQSSTNDVNNFVQIINVTGSGYIDLMVFLLGNTEFKLIIDGVVKYWTGIPGGQNYGSLIFTTPNHTNATMYHDGYINVFNRLGIHCGIGVFNVGSNEMRFPTWATTKQAAHGGVVYLSQPIYFNSSVVVQAKAFYYPGAKCSPAYTNLASAYIEGGLL